jgi:protein gp37
MGIRRKVFCSSLADVFEDRRDLDEHRLRLWQIIEATPWLDWLLLTKRPENMRRMLPAAWLDKPRLNVWAGTTVETQPYTWRIDELLAVPAVVHFLSCEPLLGALDVTPWLPEVGRAVRRSTVAWVLIGSESGPGARPMKIEWARSLVEQCKAAGVACFTKQIANASDRKGGDPRFWPPGDWPREFPEVRS